MSLHIITDEDAALQKAHEKGVEQGIERIAINMLQNNESLDKISRFTGLSKDATVKLKSKF
jgi:hypothetical protein